MGAFGVAVAGASQVHRLLVASAKALTLVSITLCLCLPFDQGQYLGENTKGALRAALRRLGRGLPEQSGIVNGVGGYPREQTGDALPAWPQHQGFLDVYQTCVPLKRHVRQHHCEHNEHDGCRNSRNSDHAVSFRKITFRLSCGH